MPWHDYIFVHDDWRLDHTGGDYHDAHLACDLLTDGSYHQ